MKILILEDGSQRVQWFRKTLGEDIWCVSTPESAIDVLKIHNDFDTIYLDHDLLPEHYFQDTNCNKTTGLAVAEFLASHPENNPEAKILIHSRNCSGVGRMVAALVRGNRAVTAHPFHILSGLYI